MTDTEAKALALVNEVERQEGLSDLTPRIMRGLVMDEALCRAIEQHEAFRQEVSKAITDLTYAQHQYTFARGEILGHLEKFVLKEPADPLVEVMNEMGFGMSKTASEEFRAALAARGLTITETKE